MTTLDPNTARKIVEDRSDTAAVLGNGGKHRQYAFRYKLLIPNGRHISISSADTRVPTSRGTREGATVYINRLSCALEPFPVAFTEQCLPGVTVTKEYRKGSSGATGDKGLSSAAASLDTLDPRDNDVLRLSVTDREALKRLLQWYAGEIQFATPALPIAEREDPAEGDRSSMNTAVDLLNDHAADPGPESSEVFPAETVSTSPDDDEAFKTMADPERRAAVEQYAVARAKAHYESSGYAVCERGKPFDLKCVPRAGTCVGTQEVHVEVKGTVGSGKVVHLTRNEVLDASSTGSWRSDLYIVSRIVLERFGPSATWLAKGGVDRCIIGWRPDDADLSPTDYDYRVPPP